MAKFSQVFSSDNSTRFKLLLDEILKSQRVSLSNGQLKVGQNTYKLPTQTSQPQTSTTTRYR